jgi:hypothetical protein
VFSSSADDENYTDVFADLDITEEIKNDLLTYIKRRLAPQPVKIRADIEVTCFTYEGIDAIKAALSEGEERSTADCPVRIKLIAPPMYVMTCMTLDKEQGLETMNQSIELIAASIRAKGYVLRVALSYMIYFLFVHAGLFSPVLLLLASKRVLFCCTVCRFQRIYHRSHFVVSPTNYLLLTVPSLPHILIHPSLSTRPSTRPSVLTAAPWT